MSNAKTQNDHETQTLVTLKSETARMRRAPLVWDLWCRVPFVCSLDTFGRILRSLEKQGLVTIDGCDRVKVSQ